VPPFRTARRTTALTTTMTTVGLPDTFTYTTTELISCLVEPSACAYGSEGLGRAPQLTLPDLLDLFHRQVGCTSYRSLIDAVANGIANQDVPLIDRLIRCNLPRRTFRLRPCNGVKNVIRSAMVGRPPLA
jgi:hypothetical protein